MRAPLRFRRLAALRSLLAWLLFAGLPVLAEDKPKMGPALPTLSDRKIELTPRVAPTPTVATPLPRATATTNATPAIPVAAQPAINFTNLQAAAEACPGSGCYSVKHDFVIQISGPAQIQTATTAVTTAQSNYTTLDGKTKSATDARNAAQAVVTKLAQGAAEIQTAIDAYKNEADALGPNPPPEKAQELKDKAYTAAQKMAEVQKQLTDAKTALATAESELTKATQAQAAAKTALEQALKALATYKHPADVSITGLGFAVALGHWGVGCSQQYGAGYGTSSFLLLKAAAQLKLFPDQTPFDPCGLVVLPGEFISDGHRGLVEDSFSITGAGSWTNTLEVKPWASAQPSAAGYKLVVTRYSLLADGVTRVIEGSVASAGIATPWQGTVGQPVYVVNSTPRGVGNAFSHSAIRITGGADAAKVTINWTPNMQIGAGDGESVGFDPVAFGITNGTQVIRREDLFNVKMRAAGKGARMKLGGDGALRVDADEAELDVKMPSALVSNRSDLRLAVKRGAVSERAVTGTLIRADKLPPMGLRSRANAAAPKTAAATEAPVLANLPKLSFDIAIPTLRAGERFELTLGGGGSQR